jgi:hypothetical protein
VSKTEAKLGPITEAKLGAKTQTKGARELRGKKEREGIKLAIKIADRIIYAS